MKEKIQGQVKGGGKGNHVRQGRKRERRKQVEGEKSEEEGNEK